MIVAPPSSRCRPFCDPRCKRVLLRVLVAPRYYFAVAVCAAVIAIVIVIVIVIVAVAVVVAR